MRRKLYLDLALLVFILGGIGVFVFMQHAPATDTGSQEAITASGTGCCGAATVEGDTPQATAGGCCGTQASQTAQSDNVFPQVQNQETSKSGEAATQMPQSEKMSEGGCVCGSQ